MRVHTPKKLTALAGATALVLGLAAAPVPASAQDEMTAEKLIEKNVEARGGKEKLESIETARIQATMTAMGPQGSMEIPVQMEWKAPDKMRVEFTVQGMKGIQAYDGETGWTLMPFMGKTEPQKMSGEELEQTKDQFQDIRGALYNPEEQGYAVEYVGEEEVEGTPAYKLKLTKGDDVTYYYLDKDYFLEFKTEGKMTTPQGQEVSMATSIGDYKEVGGVMFAHSMDMTPEGAPAGAGQNITMDKVELNVELPDSRFEMPEAAPAAEGSEGDGR